MWWSVAGEKPILMHGPGLDAMLVVHYRWPSAKLLWTGLLGKQLPRPVVPAVPFAPVLIVPPRLVLPCLSCDLRLRLPSFLSRASSGTGQSSEYEKGLRA